MTAAEKLKSGIYLTPKERIMLARLLKEHIAYVEGTVGLGYSERLRTLLQKLEVSNG